MRNLALALFMMSLAGLSQAEGKRDDYMRMYVVDDRYENVREDIELAITGRGIKVNNVAHIGEMLARTGEAIGAAKQIFVRAEALEFCSASLSRKAMEADPHNIVFCPYIIFIYSLPGEQDRTYVSYRRPLAVGDEASQTALRNIENLLQGIIEEVAK